MKILKNVFSLSGFFFIAFLLSISCNSVEESGPAKQLKEHAVPIKSLTTLNLKIYNEIKDYDVIMIGEMHGTNEPSEFALGLSNLIVENEGSVILGLEIPPSQMEGYSDEMSFDQLKELNFFKGENSSGQNGEAALDLIHQCNKNKGITIRFIDKQDLASRDSSMYVDILEARKIYPNTKVVTLTGNIHNWLIPFNDVDRIGGYLVKDTINFNPERIMSIGHVFNKGTMMNNIGNGLELTTIEGKDNIFNKTISSNMFFCKEVNVEYEQYTHFLYTEEVTHSEVIRSFELKN